MIFSNSLSDAKYSPFAALFKKTIDQLRGEKEARDGTIDTILRKIIQVKTEILTLDENAICFDLSYVISWMKRGKFTVEIYRH